MCVVPQFVYQTNTFTLNADQFYNFTLSLYNFWPSWSNFILNVFLQSAQTNAELQLLLSFTDLMATCAEGENSFIDSVCQNLFSEEELIL